MMITDFILGIVSALLSLGLITIISTRSLVKMLIGIEVLFNAALLFLILIGSIAPLMSSVYAILIITMAAAEILVAVSIIVLYYRKWGTTEAIGENVDVEER